MTLEQLARVHHEATRVYAENMGDTTVPKWEDLATKDRDDAVAAVQTLKDNPEAKPVEDDDQPAEVRARAKYAREMARVLLPLLDP